MPTIEKECELEKQENDKLKAARWVFLTMVNPTQGANSIRFSSQVPVRLKKRVGRNLDAG